MLKIIFDQKTYITYITYVRIMIYIARLLFLNVYDLI